MPSFVVEIEMPNNLAEFRLPEGVQRRLQELLDRQDEGHVLTVEEREEAEGLVDLAEWMSLLKSSSHPSSRKSSNR